VKILFILTYYRPHVSGLTIYVERLARALAERGHQVTVLTSHYAKQLPYEEILNGVRVVRAPVLFRLNKGVFMATFAALAWREIRAHEVVSIHLPQVEATLSAVLARLAGRKPVLTYHCDLEMPPGVWYGRLVDRITFWDNLIAGHLADIIVAYTEDFARHSPFLSRFLSDWPAGEQGQESTLYAKGHLVTLRQAPWPRPARTGQGRLLSPFDKLRAGSCHPVSHSSAKVRVILPPVVLPEPTRDGARALREQFGLQGKRVIGFAARFAYEKGAGYLINAIPHILPAVPDVHFLFAGPYLDVVGETIWYDLQPLIKQYEPYLTFLGTLSPAQMADFFAACDVVTVASINSTESFGLVQVESFLCGTPVVATDLPGVRQPVRMTGMGEIVPVADSQGLAEGIVKVLKNRAAYVRPRSEIMETFSLARTVDEYERLFEEKRK
jgi:glycosyltransferase involved in cell wall biosynthesis